MECTRSLYLPDFMTGILAALAVKRVPYLSMRQNRLDQAFERLNDDVAREAEGEGVDVRFRVRVHPVHRDSTQLHQAFYEAAQRDLISLDNPEFQKVRLKISAGDAAAYLGQLPGSPEMYLRLADRLITYYRGEDEEDEDD